MGSQRTEPRRQLAGSAIPTGVGVGAAIGLLVGMLVDQLAVGLVVGAAIGLFAGAAVTTFVAVPDQRRSAVLALAIALLGAGATIVLLVLA